MPQQGAALLGGVPAATLGGAAAARLRVLIPQQVEHAFAQRPGSLVVIAHRISSARRARRVLVLDGRHALAGSHDELLARSPLYRDLVGHWRAAPQRRARHCPPLSGG